jgi:hypothetical protein
MISPSSSHLVQDPLDGRDFYDNQRCIPVHAYCLETVLKVIRRSLYNDGYSHEESVMLGWSLPKWTGHGPWTSESTDSGDLPAGYWRGCEDQRNRWVKGIEGSHLLTVSRSMQVDEMAD